MFSLRAMRALLWLALAALPLRAAALEIGQPAPDFSLPDQAGKVHRLSDYKGHTLILAFYPKDFTTGCTCEVQAIRDAMGPLTARGAAILGVSADDVASHARFAKAYQLNFPILADPGKQAITAYGVLAPSGVANRVTFIIGPDGKVAGIDRAVNAQFSRDGERLVSRHALGLAMMLTDWKARIGSEVPNFSLLDANGATVTPVQQGKRAAVVVFLSTRCPVSAAYAGRLAALAKDPAYKDVAFLGVYPNVDETQAGIRADAQRHAFPFPVARDPGASIAGHFGARATPTVWVIDEKGNAVYRGAVDDSQNLSGVKHAYLRDALDAALAGKPVAVAQTQAFGCAIRPR